MVSAARSLRGIFISPEALVLAVTAYLVMNPPSFLPQYTRAVASGPEVAKYIALLPVAIFSWCVKESKDILLPSEDTKAILVQWPSYPDLKVRVCIGILFELLFLACAVGAWIYSPNLSNPASVTIASMAVFGSIIGGGTFYLASITVRSRLKRESVRT